MMPRAVIKGRDPEVQEKYNAMTSRRRELAERLASINSEQDLLLVNLGGFVAEGCDYKEYTDRLAELRAEREALDAGILYIANQCDLLRRMNPWLARR